MLDGFGEEGKGGREIPIVARPPNFIRPKRRKGTERVVTPGTSSRITITSSGFWGTSLDVMLCDFFLDFVRLCDVMRCNSL